METIGLRSRVFTFDEKEIVGGGVRQWCRRWWWWETCKNDCTEALNKIFVSHDGSALIAFRICYQINLALALALAALRRAKDEYPVVNFERYLNNILSHQHPAQPVPKLTVYLDAIDQMVSKKSRSRQKTQSFDLEDFLANSPPWPPVTSPARLI
ncbi:hypothetical protein L1987_30535 [Smallanthus sonchifolius]|uniref:Uncharacterized protein n=1 Tax=Smallanthus sonchifolius TaxID=185202 RepID=A0ACB9I2F9_9ASTR|nr:hypothetical protein L1987_30535 [Smallanthus sonchifolius]